MMRLTLTEISGERHWKLAAIRVRAGAMVSTYELDIAWGIRNVSCRASAIANLNLH